MDDEDKKMKSNNTFWIPVAIIIAGALVAAAVVYSNKADNSANNENIQGAAKEALPDKEDQAKPPKPGSEVVEVSLDDDPTYGPENAQVKIVEFSDYECPFCSRNVATMNKIKKNYPEKVSITFRDYPLENLHDNAKQAAIASQCAYEQEKFWEYHEKLFQNQDKLDDENLKKYAKDLNLDVKKFNNCLSKEKYKEEVEKDISDGAKAGVTGTPAVFINGRKVVGAQPYEVFKKIIEEELAN